MTERVATKNKARSLAVQLACAVSTIGLGQSAFVALVPLIAAFTGLGTAEIGMAAAAGAIAFVLGAPVLGSLGGRFDHGMTLRMLGLVVLAGQLILAGLVWAGPVAPLLGLAALITSRLIYGLGASGVTPVAQSWVLQLASPHERRSVLALISAGLGAGRIIGSAAAMTASLAAPLPFLMLVLSPMSLLLIPARAATRGRQEGNQSSRVMPFDGRVRPFLAIGFLLSMGFGQVQITLGPLLQASFGISAQAATTATGLLLTLTAATMILVQIFLMPRLGLGQRKSVVIGASLVALGALIVATGGTYALAAVGLTMGGVGMALASPSYLAWLVSRIAAGEQGSATGWLASAHVLGQGAGALLGGYLFTIAPLLPLVSCACVAALVAVTALAMTSDRREPSQSLE